MLERRVGVDCGRLGRHAGSCGAAPHLPPRDEPAPAHLLRDVDLAVWLDSLSLKFEGAWDKTLDVLRDELTSVQEPPPGTKRRWRC